MNYIERKVSILSASGKEAFFSLLLDPAAVDKNVGHRYVSHPRFCLYKVAEISPIVKPTTSFSSITNFLQANYASWIRHHNILLLLNCPFQQCSMSRAIQEGRAAASPLLKESSASFGSKWSGCRLSEKKAYSLPAHAAACSLRNDVGEQLLFVAFFMRGWGNVARGGAVEPMASSYSNARKMELER